ncbi:hypothetical protein VA249_15530 [Vibrio alfacsensis]|uniref:hypothetical protein n=1 Tax=Vibrio alfacsensis TaxID=1074311 RepID=UPI001BEE3AB2|nr:hypothetical protein [Vibrio alfacsensis]BBM64907.1 hypothetical protein VA249_15530 [Vibrio alfacsensis]
MYQEKLVSYLYDFIASERKPTSDELIYILADYLSKKPITNIHCKEISDELQTKYGFWKNAGNPQQAALDAVCKALVYGHKTPDRYRKDLERRKELEKLLAGKIVRNPTNTRTISIELR